MLGASLAIGLLYFLPRYDDIHRVVTVDEPLWLGRSANFLDGLLFLHPLDTYQFAHPGVMTMWAGALAYLVMQPAYMLHDFKYTTHTTDIHKQLRAFDIDPLQMLVYARVSKLLLQTGLFIFAIWMIDRLFGRRVAVGTAITIAF
ncbi:MAG TPA: hypothetical protein VFQ54_06910, partial [Thermomicrobiales bacterium]|nr:hypothetical protein [Thermomicrobiales bacterium]